MHAARTWRPRPALLPAVGGGLHLVGVIGLTIGHHVPANDALALLDPADTASGPLWEAYAADWTRWNTARTAAALTAAGALVLAVLDDARG